MKKILLIGKNGQLGEAITADAKYFGYEIISFDKEEMDVTKRFQIEEKINEVKPDILINASAYNKVPQAEENPTKAMELNFLAVYNLTKLCKDTNILFITYSTDYVFDGEKTNPYKEDDGPCPLQVYGLSKLAGECAVSSIYPENSFVIRTCGLYGGRH